MKSLYVMYFSPTGNTKRIALYIAAEIAESLDLSITLIDISRKTDTLHLQKDDILLLAVPILKGRIPKGIDQVIKSLTHEAGKVISVAVYGNNGPGDALLELNTLLDQKKLSIIASLLCVTEHSLHRDIARDRPNFNDYKILKGFSRKIISIYGDKKKKNDFPTFTVPGVTPYKIAYDVFVAPDTNETCVNCKICAIHCPVQAISYEHPRFTMAESCILCMRCVEDCPQKAITLPTHYQEQIQRYLEKVASEPKENELFYLA